LEAAKWYSEQQPSLGMRFSDAVYEKLITISSNPNLFQQRYKHVRAALVTEFPYAIYYTTEGDKIVVHAVLHSKRNPRIWKKRTKL
jgi:plasmid stabilization system protein ParE